MVFTALTMSHSIALEHTHPALTPCGEVSPFHFFLGPASGKPWSIFRAYELNSLISSYAHFLLSLICEVKSYKAFTDQERGTLQYVDFISFGNYRIVLPFENLPYCFFIMDVLIEHCPQQSTGFSFIHIFKNTYYRLPI